MSLHRRTHPGLDQPDCFGCKAASISISTYIDWTAHKVTTRELAAYERVRKEGSQPGNTLSAGVEHAKRESDTLGRAFNAADLAGTYHPEEKKRLTGELPKGPGM